MRYRRMSYRYALVLSAGEPRPLGNSVLVEHLGVHLAQTCWRPAADIYETADAILVTVDLAGVDIEAVDLTLFDDAIVVEGQRRLPAEDEGGLYHMAEIRQGPFRLEMGLPAAIDAEQVESCYERGLLQLTIPKSKAR
jgi:HSP20 family protein